MRKLLSRAKKFFVDIARDVGAKLKGFVKGLYEHAEATVVLVLASYGATALLSEIPFYVALPVWVEITMLIPAIGATVVLCLVLLSMWRHQDAVAA